MTFAIWPLCCFSVGNGWGEKSKFFEERGLNFAAVLGPNPLDWIFFSGKCGTIVGEEFQTNKKM